MNKVVKFFHELLNPHCEHCQEQQDVVDGLKDYCNSCETLKMELARANDRITQLLDKIIKIDEPTVMAVQEKMQPINRNKMIPWAVKKQQLEETSREKAKSLRNASKSDEESSKVTESLETKLGIGNAGTN